MASEDDKMSTSSEQLEGSLHTHPHAASTATSASESRLTSRRLCLRRCLTALGLSLDQLLIVLEQNEHFFAPIALNRKREEFVKLHMNGTNNSRRFIHVYLWWARLLGPNYPISDDMLQGRVWKHLRCTCGEGILDTRGHRRPADPHRVCIGPTHYTLAPGADLLGLLREDAENLCREVVNDNGKAMDFLARLHALLAEQPDVEALIAFIRRECPVFSFKHAVFESSLAADPDSSPHVLATSLPRVTVLPRASAAHDTPLVAVSPPRGIAMSGADALLLAARLISSSASASTPTAAASSIPSGTTATTTTSIRSGTPSAPLSPPRHKRTVDSDGSDEDFTPPRQALARPAGPHRSPLRRPVGGVRPLAQSPKTRPRNIANTFGVVPTQSPIHHSSALAARHVPTPPAPGPASSSSSRPDDADTESDEERLEIADEVTTMTKQLSVEDAGAAPLTTAPLPTAAWSTAAAGTSSRPASPATHTTLTHATPLLTAVTATAPTTITPLLRTAASPASSPSMRRPDWSRAAATAAGQASDAKRHAAAPAVAAAGAGDVVHVSYTAPMLLTATGPVPMATTTTSSSTPAFAAPLPAGQVLYMAIPVSSVGDDGKLVQGWQLMPVALPFAAGAGAGAGAVSSSPSSSPSVSSLGAFVPETTSGAAASL